MTQQDAQNKRMFILFEDRQEDGHTVRVTHRPDPWEDGGDYYAEVKKPDGEFYHQVFHRNYQAAVKEAYKASAHYQQNR